MFYEQFYAAISRMQESLPELTLAHISLPVVTVSIMTGAIVGIAVTWYFIRLVQKRSREFKNGLQSLREDEFQHLTHQLAERTDELPYIRWAHPEYQMQGDDGVIKPRFRVYRSEKI